MSLPSNGGSAGCTTCGKKKKQQNADPDAAGTSGDKGTDLDHMFGEDGEGANGEPMQMAANGQPGTTTYGYGPYWGLPATPDNIAKMNANAIGGLGTSGGGAGLNLNGTITPGGVGQLGVK